MPAAVSETLRATLQDATRTHGLVIWFDWFDNGPQYTKFADSLGPELDGIPVIRFARSYLALRREVEPFISLHDHDGELRQNRPDPAIVYIPIDRHRTHDALSDLLAVAREGVLAPGLPGNRNTGLHVIARRALDGRIPPAQLEEYVKRIQSPDHAQRLSLEDLDQLGDRGLGTGALALVFGTDDPTEIALAFLSSTDLDDSLVARGAVFDLVALFEVTFALPAAPAGGDPDPHSLRVRLERHILLTEFVTALGPQVPKSLSGSFLTIAPTGAGRKAVSRLASAWRASRDRRQTNVDAADRVAAELGDGLFDDLSPAALGKATTFRQTEAALLRTLAAALIADRSSTELIGEAAAEADRRIAGFWSEIDPAIRVRWQMLSEAAGLIGLAATVARELKRPRKPKAADLVRLYANGQTGQADSSPWCLLDSHHRHFMIHYHRYDWQDGVDDTTRSILERLAAAVRTRHSNVTHDLAEVFTTALELDSFSVPGIPTQIDIFPSRVGVAPAERTAYVLVDALRYEMARELAAAPPSGWQAAISPALATFPSITPVGMASLMPGAERGVSLIAAGTTKSRSLRVEIGGADVTTRDKRLALLRNAWPGLEEIKLDDLSGLSSSRRGKIEKASHVLLTSQEIDAIPENMGEGFARKYMGDVLDDLRAAFRLLASCGIARIVVVADHGYLFGDEATGGEKIEPPGGEEIELKRRVWIGRGGSAAAGYLRLQSSDLGLGGDLEFATPRSTAVFASGGGMAYFHGGLSLQELVIPVLELSRTDAGIPITATAAPRINWDLVPGSKSIATRFFSVTIQAESSEPQLALLPAMPPRIRVDLRSEKGRLGSPEAASYGLDLATGEIQLAPDPSGARPFAPVVVTFFISDEITEETKPTTAVVIVADALTGIERARLSDLPVNISF